MNDGIRYNFFVELSENPYIHGEEILSFTFYFKSEKEVIRILTKLYNEYHILDDAVYRMYEIYGKFCTLFLYVDVFNEVYSGLYRLNKDIFIRDLRNNICNMFNYV